MSAKCFETLVFCELEVGDKFISLPYPGDNSGHGGLRQYHWLFKKTSPHTAYRELDGTEQTMSDYLEIIKIF